MILDIGEALAREFFDEVAVGHSLGSDFFAVHESVHGTSETSGNVRSTVAIGGKADSLCSL